MPVPQDARLAMNAIEPLDKLKAQLQDPTKTSPGVTASFPVQQFMSDIDEMIGQLNNMIGLATGGDAEAAEQEIAEESALRSQGQQERHERYEECEPEKEPEDAPGRAPRLPSRGARKPEFGRRMPAAKPRLQTRRMM